MEMISALVKVVIAAAGILLTAYVIPWMKQKIGDTKLERLLAYTEYAVRYAEQFYSADQWRDKKEFVYKYITERAEAFGLDISALDVNVLVEGIVNSVKHGGD